MFEAQIGLGVQLLDKVCPGWENKIDLDILDVGDPEVCIIGQLFGSSADDVEALFGVDDLDHALELGYGCGFYVAVYEYEDLTEEWKNTIEELR